MPKKRAPLHCTKPINPVHPSLSSSDQPKNLNASRSFHSTLIPSGNLVNDELQRLRQSQAPSNLSARSRGQNDPINVPGATLPDLNLTRPPPDRDIVGRMRIQRQAGPRPPKSWLNSHQHDALSLQESKRSQPRQRERILLERLDILPDLYLPEARSLMLQILRALARNWQWHVQYDQYSLVMLPTRLKEALISVIARYSPHDLNLHSLEILFIEDTMLEDASDNEDVTHLDLSTLIGDSLSLNELKKFLVGIPKATMNADSKAEDESIPEDWDTPLTFPLSHHPVSRLPFLTQLSLSHPVKASWKSLLNLAPHLVTLTHLSLAFWPFPTMNSLCLTDSEIPLGNVSYRVQHSNWSEVAAILRQLSKKTYCLKWLDLTGCYAWIWALECEDGIDWNGPWRRLETVKVGQGWMPDCLNDENMKLSEHFIDRFQNYNVIGWENRNSEAALTTWLRYEKRVGKLEQAVNGFKSRCAQKNMNKLAEEGPSVDELIFSRDEFDNWWEKPLDSASCSAGSKDDGREKRVTFERGWEGWWIDEAIKAF